MASASEWTQVTAAAFPNESPSRHGSKVSFSNEKEGKSSGSSRSAGQSQHQVSIPPLSSLMNPKESMVDLEVDHLESAMAWLFGAVQGIQKHQSGLMADVKRLEGTLKQWAAGTSGTPAVGGKDGSSEPQIVNKELRQSLQKLEQERIAAQKMVEMRLDSLSSSFESRLKASDLDELRRNLTEKIEKLHSNSREEIALLGSNLQRESAEDRRRLQSQFEALREKVESQLQLGGGASSGSQGEEIRLKAAVAAAESAAAAAAASAASCTGGWGGGSVSWDAGTGGDEGVVSISPEDKLPFTSVGPPAAGSAFPAGPRELMMRLERVEQELAAMRSAESAAFVLAPGEELSGEVIGKQLVELHKMQSEMHGRVLEVSSRVTVLEKGGGVVVPDDEKVEEPKKEPEVPNVVAEKLVALTGSLDIISQYISGDVMGSDFSPAARKENAETDLNAMQQKLQRMEKRLSSFFGKKKGSKGLEARLKEFESFMGNQEVKNRLDAIDKTLGKVSMDVLKEVPPRLNTVEHEQEVLKKDLRREVQELKVIVGSLEACVPKETRKAIQLFKRAAGVNEEFLISPEALSMDSKLLSLREDLESRLTKAETTVVEQVDNINKIVKGFERKQVAYEQKLGIEVPTSPAKSEGPSVPSTTQSPAARALPTGWAQK
eukprot:TRINITY_DN12064_c0_g1_i1.p1 TRINITY_DN12064_c0_g1~~TRINITY_DN12064_c0_g1_i1.p1  ORF type:complete len:678 (-),score=195.45 TRINITY_DN12064_c0_g1_i1:51-2033(-)